MQTYQKNMLETLSRRAARFKSKVVAVIEHRLLIDSLKREGRAEITVLTARRPFRGLVQALQEPIEVGCGNESWSSSVDRVLVHVRNVEEGAAVGANQAH
jgi:hypothetical protein